MLNSNWARWITASLTKHFVDRLNPLKVMLAGEERDEANPSQDFVELRIDGPDITEMSRNYYFFNIAINLLIQSKRTPNDLYKIHRDSGLGMAAFENNLSIYKYGDGPDDDQSSLGCMILQSGVLVQQLGQIAPNANILQAMVSGDYQMTLGG
jgi:hypothetical protein